MSAANPKIELIAATSGSTLWETTCRKVAEISRGNIWELPLWLVADGRHRQQAEITLMRHLGQGAIPTDTIKTITSLAADILGWSAHSCLATPADVAIILREIPDEDLPEIYRSSRAKPGFAESFWSSLIEVEAAGHLPETSAASSLPPHPPAEFSELQNRLQRRFEQHHLYTPSCLVEAARKALMQGGSKLNLPAAAVLGPFLTLNRVERDFLKALAEQAKRVVLVPATGADWVQSFSGENLPSRQMQQRTEMGLLRPRTPEEEGGVVFAFIAEKVARGEFNYRDFRLIHPTARLSLQSIKSAARRYQVPLKGRLQRPLADFPGSALLNLMLNLFTSHWSKQAFLEVLRSRLVAAPTDRIAPLISALLLEWDTQPATGAMPWSHLLQSDEDTPLYRSLKSLWRLDHESRTLKDGHAFTIWLKKSLSFIRQQLGELPEDVSHEYTFRIEEAAGWKALEELIDIFGILSAQNGTWSRFVEAFRAALHLESYVAVDHRLDAVELCPGNREDHLPVSVIIYPSLSSRFPPPGRLHPFLDQTTSAGFHDQERLFNLLISNARNKVLLSCPQFDDDGNALALSPLLFPLKSALGTELAMSHGHPWRSFPAHRRDLTEQQADYSARQENRLNQAHSFAYLQFKNRSWSITQFENTIQCYYLHFAADLLGLFPLRDRGREGITAAQMGLIAHAALSEYVKATTSGEVFDLIAWCQDAITAKADPTDPHLERDRAQGELLKSLQDFMDRGWERLAPGFKSWRLELPFGKSGAEILPLVVSQIELEGRIDRLDADSSGRVIVVDYKYQKSGSESQNQFFAELTSGYSPQLLLYGLAVAELLFKVPVAWINIYLRSGDLRGLRLKGIDLSQLEQEKQIREISPEDLKALLEKTLIILREKVEVVAQGTIRPTPRDYDRCGPGLCPYADLCRFRVSWKRLRNQN